MRTIVAVLALVGCQLLSSLEGVEGVVEVMQLTRILKTGSG